MESVDLGSIKVKSKVYLIPLPPIAEQHRIVAEVERRLSIIQRAEEAVDASLKRAERLRQSVLKQAFCGRLVPQDLGDEPASALLERIRAERAECSGRRRIQVTSVDGAHAAKPEPSPEHQSVSPKV